MKTESPWKRLSEFIARINKNTQTQAKPGDASEAVIEKWMSGAVAFSREELGGLILAQEDSAEYRRCVKAVHDVVAGKRGQISMGTVESAIEVTVLKMLDINKSDTESDFSKRQAREIEELRRSLTRKADTYLVRLEVQGLDQSGLPRQFGDAKFYVADETSVLTLQTETGPNEETRDEAREKQFEAHRALRRNMTASMKGKTYAEIEVEAFDEDSAALLAEKELRLTLDVLNYFSDFFSREGAMVFLPGEVGPSRHLEVVSKKGDARRHKLVLSHRRSLPPLSLPSTASPAKNVDAFEKASALLQKRTRNSLEARLLAALQWAGRASTEDRKDNAFLFYCISLEALLTNQDKGETTFAFALRGAHLLLQDASMRGKLFSDLKDLYQLRSKIVHVGKTDISDSNLTKIQHLSRQAIFIVLVAEPFSSMTGIEDLEKWFLEQQLAGVRIADGVAQV